jgi:hypothetical protein
MSVNIPIFRLQYEILNKTLAELAAGASIPMSILQKEARDQRWKQLWPAVPKAEPESGTSLPLSYEDRQEQLALEADQYIEETNKRMRVYNLAKDIYLATKYLALEVKIIDTASSILDEVSQDIDPRNLKLLSALYKEMTSGTSLASMAKNIAELDETGLAQVIFRDFSGAKSTLDITHAIQ